MELLKVGENDSNLMIVSNHRISLQKSSQDTTIDAEPDYSIGRYSDLADETGINYENWSENLSWSHSGFLPIKLNSKLNSI